MATTTTDELTNGVNGRWLGQRGIFRHHAPDLEDIKPAPGETVVHTMSTSVANWAGVRGELTRSVDAEKNIHYAARITEVGSLSVLCDGAAFTLRNLSALAKVTNDLRYEWEQITGQHEGVVWSVWPTH